MIAGTAALFWRELMHGNFDALLGAAVTIGFFYQLAQAARAWWSAR